jgi:hypothetical protein
MPVSLTKCGNDKLFILSSDLFVVILFKLLYLNTGTCQEVTSTYSDSVNNYF